jgi:predicted TIM-barrel fold metal-dependent hydrolase
MVRDALAIFGPRRCLFGSNFPIEKLWTTYPALLAAFVDATSRLGPDVQAAIFETNAVRVYRMREGGLHGP